LGDETTFSSVSEGGRAMAAAALTTDGQVLAFGDLTFFTEPYNTVENNGTLINNIADFLTDGQREYELADFPYFFNPNVDMVFDNSLVFNSQFEDSVKLKEALEQIDRKVTFKDEIGQENDVIFVGRFDETEVVEDYLTEAKIAILDPVDAVEEEETETEESQDSRLALISDEAPGPEDRFIDGRIRVEGIGDLERGGSTLFSLQQEGGRNVMIILSDNLDTNADAFQLLLDNELPACVVDANLAVCQTEEPDGEIRPSLRSTRIDNILIVSDNDGRQRENPQTSMVQYNNVLSNTYRIDSWVTTTQGSPDVDQLLEYDAVIWTTGNYWDDSIDEEDVVMLARYMELGGNLILSGASIGFDWDHTEFLEKVAHADYLDFAEQKDLELVLPDHPIAKDFAEGAVITLTQTSTEQPLEPDVVRHTADARVIFQRGPDSPNAQAASVIAYEDDRVKVAYFAFPIYLLPPEARAMLVNNTVDWFTKKPLDLPGEDAYKPFESDDQAGDEAEEVPADEGQGEENGGGNGGEGDGNGNGNGNGEN
jgi:hypothetical protein